MIAALVALATVLGCAEETPEKPDLRPTVSAQRVRSVDFDESIRASGELKALHHATIAAEVEGRITGIRIEEGRPVDAGSVVIEIDPARRALGRDAARANLARAQATLKREHSATARQRKLGQQSIASADRLEEAETNLLMAQANHDAKQADHAAAERALADAEVRAPFTGHIAQRQVQLGQFVQKGEPLFELVALDPLEVEFSVPELDANRVREGQQAWVEVNSMQGQRFAARVTFVSPTVAPDTRTLRLRAQLENADRELRPGLFARVDLGVARREGVLMVPEQSIVQRASGASIFTIDDADRVSRVPVTTGVVRDGWVEVRGALLEGERLVVQGPARLTDGSPVNVVAEPKRPEPAALAHDAEPSGAGS